MSRISAIIALAIPLAAGGATPEDDGAAIIQKSYLRGRGFGDERVTSITYLINANRDTVVRKTRNINLERKDGDDYSLVQFMDPADVRGTGLLTYQNPGGDDLQWLYLPELRRVKKISSKNKSGAFMGSEFAYEDISGNTLKKFTYRKIGEESLNGQACHLVEKIPAYENSGYLKIKAWVSKSTFLVLRQEFTDRKNTLIKAQVFEDYKEYQGGVWLADRITMENFQTKKKSVLEFRDRQLKVGLKESDFGQQSLERIIH